MEIFSYAASFISTILGLCEPFGKKMKTILTLNFLGNLLVGISYFLVSQYSGSAICFTACFQVLINYIFDIQGKKLPIAIIVFHAVIFLAVNLVTFTVWYDILSLAAAMTFVISVAQNNTKYYRLLYVTNSFLRIFYDILAAAYGNLFTHVVLFLATSAAIIVRDFKSKK